ncbi:hypothetical protein NKJ26_02980 [Mesorhizobium sp. M0152]|uniref:hypothetical protein n=1 Tax=Mesorhizobium sp. M0152 TaxID=2956898 RepID=UPI00333BD358
MGKSSFQRRALVAAAIGLAVSFAAMSGHALQESPLAALPVPPRPPRGDVLGSNRASRRARAAMDRRGA